MDHHHVNRVELLKLGIMVMMVLSRVAFSDDQVEAPDSGLFCISDCATCPSICSPPPPVIEYPSPPTSSPPAPVHHSPPQSHYHSPPEPSPPSPRSQSAPPPGNSWTYWGTPPPPFRYSNTPPLVQAPPFNGPHDYPYPYYYFYASKASSLSSHWASILIVIAFHSVVFFYYF